MGMFSILYISTAYILTTDLKMVEKNGDDLGLSFFFDEKKISFIYNVAHFWIQVELCMYTEVGLSFFKIYILKFIISNSRSYYLASALYYLNTEKKLLKTKTSVTRKLGQVFCTLGNVN